MVLDTLTNWVGREPTGKPHPNRPALPRTAGRDRGRGPGAGAAHRTHPHGRRRHRRRHRRETVWDVQAVYLAVGYRSTPLPGLPFDDNAAVVPNAGGRVLDLSGEPIPGTYVTGWIKRGPIGLIGHTKSDAAETVANLLADTTATAPQREPEAMEAHLADRGIDYTTFAHWERLDAHGVSLGGTTRARVKVAGREEMLLAGQ
jgi:ferredoxin--NADP+ reductase